MLLPPTKRKQGVEQVGVFGTMMQVVVVQSFGGGVVERRLFGDARYGAGRGRRVGQRLWDPGDH